MNRTAEKEQFRSIGKTIYKNIRRLCRDAGITVEQLELGLGISKNSIGRWGQGKIVPRLDVLMVIAQSFDRTLDYMVTDHD